MNPLLQESKLDHEAIDFTLIKSEHFLPALEEAIKIAKKEYEQIKSITDYSFENIIIAAEDATVKLDLVVATFFALHSAHCTDELSDLAEEFNNKLTHFSSDISLDEKLFAGVKFLYDKKDDLNLSTEEMTVLKNSYLGFARNGALLNNEEKIILREIDQKLAKLSLTFSENNRKATNAYELIIEQESRLAGLPQSLKDAAKETATEKGHDGKWIFTLDYPSYAPFLQYCEDRELRKEIWLASARKCTEGEFDNSEVIKETLLLREQRAKLIGYENHPSFVLEERMAKKPENVLKFIEDISLKAKPFAAKDMEKISKIKEALTGDPEVRKYDGLFYTEKLKKQELDFDDELLRPYFKLENVIEGAFTVAQKLFGIKFSERLDLPKYHEDVKVYEVRDESDDSFLGLFYGDYFPRKEKRSGAWMTSFRDGGLYNGVEKRPFIMNVANLTKPTSDRPSLLTLNEVRTIFHELGHGLHGLLSKTKFKSTSGTNVFWDFVELPSQIMENWLTEKECLDIFAKHYETGESIPEELILKIKKSEQFLEGMGTIRQMGLSKLDMDWHLADPKSITNIREFEVKSGEAFNLYPDEGVGAMSCSFGHIFAGGYSSGYYSYKWAEVLDADAFFYFKENGVFNAEIGKKFKENILEKGGSEDPMELYKKFRGQEPSPEALMKRCGFH